MRSSKGGQEVIQHLLVGQVDGSELHAYLVAAFGSEDVVVPERQVKEVARSDTRRVVVVVFGPRRGDLNASCSEQARGATAQRRRQSWEDVAAVQADLELLIGGEGREEFPGRGGGWGGGRARD